MTTAKLCKCGHEKHEHDRAFPSGKAIYCCRQDVQCWCPQYVPFDRVDKGKVQSSGKG